MKRILIVEDNVDLAFGLQNNLEIEGYEVEVEIDGAVGLEKILSQPPDMVILDLMSPGLEGNRVLQRVRDAGIEVPVLILSAKSEEADKVRGFRFGADDYVTKPFGIMELIARVEALLRRAQGTAKNGTLGRRFQFGDIAVDDAIRSVMRDGQDAGLSPKEYDLLIALIQNKGAVVTRLQLLREVWGYAGRVRTRTVDTHIGQLRRKLETDPSHPRFILTVRKTGYRFQE